PSRRQLLRSVRLWCHAVRAIGRRDAYALRRRRCLDLALRFTELPLDEQPTVAIPVDRFEERLNLHLDVLDDLQVRRELRRELPGEPIAVLFELLLVID